MTKCFRSDSESASEIRFSRFTTLVLEAVAGDSIVSKVLENFHEPLLELYKEQITFKSYSIGPPRSVLCIGNYSSDKDDHPLPKERRVGEFCSTPLILFWGEYPLII